MSKLPSLSYIRIINALQRAGFVVVRQRGSHIRLQKRTFLVLYPKYLNMQR